MGNHDIEAGHSVYDRLVGEYNFPLLAANAVSKSTGEPYFKPYTIIEKKGIRIAVLGLTTPAVPNWLPPELYSGIKFWDMLETAKKYMPVILRKSPMLWSVFSIRDGMEPDNADQNGSHYDENGSSSVAWNVPGFDVILCGHNHNVINKKFVNSAGDTILVMEGGSRAQKIARADVVIRKDKVTGKMHKTASRENHRC